LLAMMGLLLPNDVGAADAVLTPVPVLAGAAIVGVGAEEGAAAGDSGLFATWAAPPHAARTSANPRPRWWERNNVIDSL
jgi:hypothetical protein